MNETTPRRRGRASRRTLLRCATVAAVMVFSIVVVGASVSKHHQLFVLDEATYVDYLVKAHEGELWMPRGDLYSQEALRIVDCRGVGPGVPTSGPVGDCSVRARGGEELNGGVSTSAIHPPTYFLLTSVGARIVLATGVTDDLVTAGRLVGAGWMALGLLLVIVLARELGATPAASGLIAVVLGLSQRLLEEWQYLTPDAPNLAVGSLVSLVGLRWLRGRFPLWPLPVAGATAVAFKSPNLLVVGAVATAMVVATGSERPLAARLRAAVALAGGGALAAGVIGIVMSLRAESGYQSPQDRAQHVDALTSAHFLDNLDAFLKPLVRDGRGLELSQWVFMLVLGLAIAAAFVLPASDLRQSLAAAHLLFVAAGPALLVLLVFVAQHQYFEIPERYGFNLLPGLAAVAASFWTTRLRLAVAAAVALPFCLVASARVF